MIKSKVSRYLTEDALNRLDNILFSNSELGMKVLNTLYYLIETGQINKKINDQELKELVKAFVGKKREPTIRRL